SSDLFTFVAPCANPTVRSEVAARKMMKRFIAGSLSLVDEELQLECELLLLPADFGLQVADSSLHVEVVAHRIPVNADQISLFAERLSRRRKAAIFETEPRAELGALHENAAVGDEDIALWQSRDGGASVELHPGDGAHRGSERSRHIGVQIDSRPFVVVLLVIRCADRDDLLRAEIRTRI